MGITGKKQPAFLTVDSKIRLKAFSGDYKTALPWYQDKTVYYNSEGITDPAEINEDYIRAMYDYLARHGELYFIEILADGKFTPIGDVALKEENLPIVFGAAKYRGLGIGRRVLQVILKKAREIGLRKIYGVRIYDYNKASRRLYESLGFKCAAVRGNERIYELGL